MALATTERIEENYHQNDEASYCLSVFEEQLVKETQGGLPLVEKPYEYLGKRLGVSEKEIIRTLNVMMDNGIIRRIGVVPNHYALGYVANAMSVWDIADEHVVESGELMAGFDFVSHCYQRPRHLPEWPYNVFAMVHGKSREEVNEKITIIRQAIGESVSYDLIYSTEILKKTGVRI